MNDKANGKREGARQAWLRTALTGNALFSAATGLLLLAVPHLLAEWLGISAGAWLRLLGLGLIGFALELGYQVTRRRLRPWRALLASAADGIWVLASLVLLLAFPQVLSEPGRLVVAGVAGIVAVMGACQMAGLVHLFREGPRRWRYCVAANTPQSAETLWQQVGDLGNIATYAPFLKNSALADPSDKGPVGAVRTCRDYAGHTWSEACTDFQPGKQYTVRFLTEAPDFPFPVKSMVGGWRLISQDKACRVEVWWVFEPSNALLAPLVLPFMAARVDRDILATIRLMAEASPDADHRPRRRSLVPLPC
ncbi:MAG: SRPBCC family protein [Opitutales bacterium]